MKHKFITLGEIMLRLTPPDYEKIRTATTFEARYGGSEAIVGLSLANLGIDASFFTVVPDNSLGKSSVRMMRSNDVNCDSVVLSTAEETPTHRLGTYYLETGYGIRPSKVVYDRKHSAFSEYDFQQNRCEKTAGRIYMAASERNHTCSWNKMQGSDLKLPEGSKRNEHDRKL